MVKVNYKDIGMRIKIARLKRGYTQEHLSECCEVTPQHISNIENGNTRLSLNLLIVIANCLGVSVDELLCDVVDRSNILISKEAEEVFTDCTPEEIKLLLQLLKSTKKTIHEYKKQLNDDLK